MYPIFQRLRNQRQFPAATTDLSRVVRQSCNHGDASFFRKLIRQEQYQSVLALLEDWRQAATGGGGTGAPGSPGRPDARSAEQAA